MYLILMGMLLSAAAPVTDSYQILEAVRAYETRFDHCEMHYRYQPREERNGQMESSGVGSEAVYRILGKRQRIDVSMVDSGTGVKETRTRVTDGEQATDWHMRDVDSAGQATIQPANETTDAGFRFRDMHPLTAHSAATHDEEITVSLSDSTAILAWAEHSAHRYELECRRIGSEWCPVRLSSIWQQPGQPAHTGMEQTYTYDPARQSDGIPYPVRIDLVAPGHRIHDVYHILEIDFSPTFDDSIFELEFKEGTWVTDKATGITRRHYRSGASYASVARAVHEAMDLPPQAAHLVAEARKPDLDKAVSFLASTPSVPQKAPRRVWWWPATVACALVVGVGATGLGVYLRRRRVGQGGIQ